MSPPSSDPPSTPVSRSSRAPITPIPGGTELVAGYRVLRRSGDRHGGHVRTAALEAAGGGLGDAASRTVVSIVTFDTAVAEERSMRLIDRLERLAAPGVPRVLDVVVEDGGGPAVVLEFCGDSIASILAGGAEITAGEVVTLVAPILTALVTLHDRGFAHGDVSIASIAVGGRGRPLLVGCERAVELPDEHAQAREVAADDLRRLADSLTELSREVRDPKARARVVASAAAIRSGAVTPFSPAFRAAAEVRLFEIAEPSPLAFSATEERELLDAETIPPLVRSAGALRPRSPERRSGLLDAAGGLIARVRGRLESRARVERRHPSDREDRAGQGGRVDKGGRGDQGDRTGRHRGLGLRGRRESGQGSARSRRRGPLIVGAAIVGVTIAFLVVVPAWESARSTGATDDAAATRARQASSDPASGFPAPSASQTSTAGPASSGRAEPADDAVVGARAALDAIASCAAASDDSCWRSVIEPDTALLEEVSASKDPLSALPAALALPVDAVEITPRDDYGDLRVVLVAPVDETRPASVLMIRTEAGWRVRDAFDA
ncbi:hypothetical protein ELQ90_06005 [Labedella phragmitis]|uniref:Protein kinase domain-containing protein n=1 Tax=Labedella phragmitis TaxID=2498849 RepID=A0A3S3ZB41_9MICO|nr:hypothetical protein [Labedella phragmitis]RWZ51653.1 hypothetical protein ELQ90_06005 [Labedella phragmitis]